MEKDVWALSMGSQITCPSFHNRGQAKRLKNRTSGMKWRLCCLTSFWGKLHKRIRAGNLGHVCTISWKWGDIYRGASRLYRKVARFCPFPGRAAFTAGLGLLSFARRGSGWPMSLDARPAVVVTGPLSLHARYVPSPGLSPVPEMFHVNLTDCCHLQRAQAALSIPHGLGSS